MINNLGDPLLPVLKSALDINWLQQQAISQNIANADTPNYKRVDVDFSKILTGKMANRLAMTRTHHTHLVAGSNREEELPLVTTTGTRSRNDGNNVDLEQEMALQAEVLLQYYLLTQLTTEHLGMLRLAITEGRR